MKILALNGILAIVFFSASISLFSQCEILNRVSPDGSMLYFIEPVNFYWTKTKSLKGGIVTDKENYFLQLYPIPFPEKPDGNKLKKELTLKLSDEKIYVLKHFDSRYVDNDTVFEMMYLISKEDMEAMLEFEVIESKIDMMGDEGIRNYGFKLHKAALKEQLNCFLKEDKEKKE